MAEWSSYHGKIVFLFKDNNAPVDVNWSFSDCEYTGALINPNVKTVLKTVGSGEELAKAIRSLYVDQEEGHTLEWGWKSYEKLQKIKSFDNVKEIEIKEKISDSLGAGAQGSKKIKLTEKNNDYISLSLIKRAKSNKAKMQTYAELLGKYKESIDNGYYGEAELIVYAYLEDRFKSFLYYIEAIDSKNDRSINSNMQRLFGSEQIIDNITAKMEVIETSIKKCGKLKGEDEYAAFLDKVYKYAFNKSEFKSSLKAIRNWCKYRNELIHGLFNKDLEDLHSGYRAHVEDGYQLARQLDNYVEQLKRV